MPRDSIRSIVSDAGLFNVFGRKMYCTRRRGGILKAVMDGTNVVEIGSSVTDPGGMVIDFSLLRLYWTDCATEKLQSSDLDGQDLKVIAQFSNKTCPWGIALQDDQLIWGNHGSKSIQTSYKTGQNVRMLYNGTLSIQHLTLTTSAHSQTRINHCDGQDCSGICVLNTNSFRCLP